MIQAPLCHLLIGLPGSGKSTFAKQLNQQIPSSVIVSTDAVREQLYGNEVVQGDWSSIEQEVIRQVKSAITDRQPVIYDATNVKASWRSSFLNNLSSANAEWIAWQMTTPPSVCKSWNKRRTRQVPEHVIDLYQSYLEQSIPQISEGFIAVKRVQP